MQTLRISWHRKEGLGTLVPDLGLRALYETVQIDLLLNEDHPVARDPMSWTDLDRLQTRHKPPRPALADGHLVLLKAHRDDDTTVLGEVFGETHGVAVVYVGHLAPDDPSTSLLSVCAHEIGHLCNLTHGLADESNFDSVMKQAIDRNTVPARAWEMANTEAIDEGAAGVRRPDGLDCLPFNYRCRHRLGQPIQAWGPWTTRFLGLGETDTKDLLVSGLEIAVHPHRIKCKAGDDVAFDLEVMNTTARSISIPVNLHPDFGYIKVIVQSDGGERSYSPRSLSCSESFLTISARSSSFFPIALLDDQRGDLITQPGRYIIIVHLRYRSDQTSRSENNLTAKFELLADASEATPAVSAATARERWPFEPSKDFGGAHHRALRDSSADPMWLRLAESPAAPRAVRHAAVMRQARSLSGPQLESFAERMHKLYPSKMDETLHFKLANSVRLRGRR